MVRQPRAIVATDTQCNLITRLHDEFVELELLDGIELLEEATEYLTVVRPDIGFVQLNVLEGGDLGGGRYPARLHVNRTVRGIVLYG